MQSRVLTCFKLQKLSKDNAHSTHVQKNHPTSSIIGDLNTRITIRKKQKIDYAKLIANICHTSPIEFTTFNEALKDEICINVMQDELIQFKRNNI